MSKRQRAERSASPATLKSLRQALDEVKDRLLITEQKELGREAALNHILALQTAHNELLQTYRRQDEERHQETLSSIKSSRHVGNTGLAFLRELVSKWDIEREEDRVQREEDRRREDDYRRREDDYRRREDEWRMEMLAAMRRRD